MSARPLENILVAARSRRARDGVSRRDGCPLRGAHHARTSRAPRGHAPGSGVARGSVDRHAWVASAIGTGGHADRRMRPVSHRRGRIARRVVSSRKSAAQSQLRAGVERFSIDPKVRPAVAARLASEAAVEDVAVDVETSADEWSIADNRGEGIDDEHRVECRVHGRVARVLQRCSTFRSCAGARSRPLKPRREPRWRSSAKPRRRRCGRGSTPSGRRSTSPRFRRDIRPRDCRVAAFGSLA